jgi:glycosyltransferase involved in cell wall biosynthesis
LNLHLFSTIALGAAAALWIYGAIEAAIGVPRLASLAGAPPLDDADCPSISILFAARDEAHKLPGALATLLVVDYPRYEVVAVNDRSEDGTEEILKRAAQENPHMKAVSVRELPGGWLGKPHALQKAYEQSTGEWLIFTDADVHFAPGLLRSAISLAQKRGWEHLTLSGRTEIFSFGEKVVMTFFGLAFLMSVRPWRVSDTRSRAFAGVGMFQLIRRSAYEAMGTHRRLAMEVVDDMKLGKLAKQEGFRSGLARAGDDVSVHWHSGLGNIIKGTTKNFFAFAEFSLLRCEHTDFRDTHDVRRSLGGAAFRSRVGAIIRRNCRGTGDHSSRRCVHRIQNLAGICVDVPYRCADFCVDAGTLDDCYFVDRRSHLARDILSAGGIETRSRLKKCCAMPQS